jgi:hypothetical protein
MPLLVVPTGNALADSVTEDNARNPKAHLVRCVPRRRVLPRGSATLSSTRAVPTFAAAPDADRAHQTRSAKQSSAPRVACLAPDGRGCVVDVKSSFHTIFGSAKLHGATFGRFRSPVKQPDATANG